MSSIHRRVGNTPTKKCLEPATPPPGPGPGPGVGQPHVARISSHSSRMDRSLGMTFVSQQSAIHEARLIYPARPGTDSNIQPWMAPPPPVVGDIGVGGRMLASHARPRLNRVQRSLRRTYLHVDTRQVNESAIPRLHPDFSFTGRGFFLCVRLSLGADCDAGV